MTHRTVLVITKDGDFAKALAPFEETHSPEHPFAKFVVPEEYCEHSSYTHIGGKFGNYTNPNGEWDYYTPIERIYVRGALVSSARVGDVDWAKTAAHRAESWVAYRKNSPNEMKYEGVTQAEMEMNDDEYRAHCLAECALSFLACVKDGEWIDVGEGAPRADRCAVCKNILEQLAPDDHVAMVSSHY